MPGASMGSSPPALAAGLAAAGLKKLAARAAALEGKDSKLEAFRALLDGELAGEKVLVFAETRETIEYLRAALAKKRIEALAYVGDLTPAERDKLVARFRDPDGPRVLLCTELGGEGRNFQHCHVLVNYDLSWSPAAIEQRIGRIDRIGQEREVFVFNLVTRGTLEEQVLHLLEEKISMFELVVGEVGAILGALEEERDFSELVLDAWLHTTEAGRVEAFDAIGRRLDEVRRQHADAQALDEALFGEAFETA